MKKVLKKVMAGTLAILMVLTSIAFDWGSVSKVKAADEISGVEADFTKDAATVLD